MIEETAGFDHERLWRDLETKLRPFVAKRVRHSDVDDVVQDVFLRIQRGLPALRDDQRLGPWVYQVARSAIGDYARQRARHPETTAALAVPDAAPDDEGESVIEQRVAAYAALLVSMLPSPYREALALTELQGMSQTKAAQMLGISVSGMKSRVQRGRAKLRAALLDCCHIALDARRRVVACEVRADGKLPDGCCN